VQQDVFSEQGEDIVPLIPEQPPAPLQAVAPPPPAAAAAAEVVDEPGDALDIADIFAFMR
jgi:hypothetical protein